ncbi:metal-dependent transcriptional regulator [Labedella endophytica]|uniref:Manganese transport regulator n=2 Tax=Labedella endophytica TaxID=1523160 RepID=A0A3S0XDV0_9MICO|nr:metal-dependent transcriptional regulator [Labedella endophytica]
MAQDYVSAIWKCEEWSDGRATAGDIAARLGVATSTVSGNLRKLVSDGLVEHERYGAITLTADGRAAAVQMVRRHRLLETYLVERLGYAWDEVHDEAEHLEHAASETFIDRIDRDLGHPVRDPHGDLIPRRDGRVEVSEAIVLDDLSVGESGTVARISDEDPALLRYLAEHGLRLDARITVRKRIDVAGILVLARDESGGGGDMELGMIAGRSVFVLRDGDHAGADRGAGGADAGTDAGGSAGTGRAAR